jgi:hypothetical protein
MAEQQVVVQSAPETEQVDGYAMIGGDLLKAKATLVRMSAEMASPESKKIMNQLAQTVVEFMIDIVKLGGDTRDAFLGLLGDLNDRIVALEEEAPLAPVMDEEDAKFLIQVVAEGIDAQNTLMAIAEFAKAPHNAAEYESFLRKIAFDKLGPQIERGKAALLKITELAAEEEEEDEEGDETDAESDGTTAPGGEG